MIKRICISAYNIHQGGGRVVLLAFLKEKIAENNQLTCYIDERLDIDFSSYDNVKFVKIKASLKERILAEYRYREISKNYDFFYFMGNLPPLFKLNCKVILFVQNRLIISPPYINTFSLKTVIRSIMEIIWFKVFLKNVNTIEVQTPSMKKAILARTPSKKVVIHNYIDMEELVKLQQKFEIMGLKKEKGTFIYIASPDPHKNIGRLILAFSKINTAEYLLQLNINEKSKYFTLARKKGVNLICIKDTDREEILKRIYCSEYLIFPSLIESLGMPLVEAKAMGTKIIASDLDFVLDACKPIGKFNPYDIDSIAKEIEIKLSSET